MGLSRRVLVVLILALSTFQLTGCDEEQVRLNLPRAGSPEQVMLKTVYLLKGTPDKVLEAIDPEVLKIKQQLAPYHGFVAQAQSISKKDLNDYAEEELFRVDVSALRIGQENQPRLNISSETVRCVTQQPVSYTPYASYNGRGRSTQSPQSAYYSYGGNPNTVTHSYSAGYGYGGIPNQQATTQPAPARPTRTCALAPAQQEAPSNH